MMNSNLIRFAELMSYAGDVYIEFRVFTSANTHSDIFYSFIWVNYVFKHYEIKNPQYGKDWRLWRKEPTKEERAAEPWEE